MTVNELANCYKDQAELLSSKVEGLKPLLHVYTGNDLATLKHRIKFYYNMSVECKRISKLLLANCEE